MVRYRTFELRTHGRRARRLEGDDFGVQVEITGNAASTLLASGEAAGSSGITDKLADAPVTVRSGDTEVVATSSGFVVGISTAAPTPAPTAVDGGNLSLVVSISSSPGSQSPGLKIRSTNIIDMLYFIIFVLRARSRLYRRRSLQVNTP